MPQSRLSHVQMSFVNANRCPQWHLNSGIAIMWIDNRLAVLHSVIGYFGRRRPVATADAMAPQAPRAESERNGPADTRAHQHTKRHAACIWRVDAENEDLNAHKNRRVQYKINLSLARDTTH